MTHMNDYDAGPRQAGRRAYERSPARRVRPWPWLRHFALLLLTLIPGLASAAAPLSLAAVHEGPIGASVSYYQETGDRLVVEQAAAALAADSFRPAAAPILNFGIGARPVWLHFSVVNDTGEPLQRQLTVETTWLDRVEFYVRQDGRTLAMDQAGDSLPFSHRSVDSRHFVFRHSFAPGRSQVFIRVQTPDPMLVPLYLHAPEQARTHATLQQYSYGVLYGFLLALLIYNLMLYAGLGMPRYGLYSLYLGAFLLMNVAYTGHGFRWLWPDSPGWAQWSNPVLMVLYGVAGLVFAMSFLETRRNFPRVHRAVLAYIGAGVGLLGLAALFSSQHFALLVAFSFVTLFTLIMLSLGLLAVRGGMRAARYFLLAAVAAMAGAATTALAVWGYIPTSLWTYRAVDLGMLLDAILLALALTYQFRVGQSERRLAEQLARQDPLTGMNNRRAFTDAARPVWNIARRQGHPLAVVLLDIDCFKRINDSYGHAYGDKVLITVAEVIIDTIRKQDVAARWGGEEFILLLPETGLEEAAALAERLRQAIEAIRLRWGDDIITVTASFGVAGRDVEHSNLDSLISVADKYLYQAKHDGRNRVRYRPVASAA